MPLAARSGFAETIRDRGAGHVPAPKGNQPHLQEAMVETFAVEQAEAFEGCDHDFHKTVNKNHGRIETRRCWALGTPEYLQFVDPDGAWPDLHSLVMIEAQRRQGSQVASETRYHKLWLPATSGARQDRGCGSVHPVQGSVHRLEPVGMQRVALRCARGGFPNPIHLESGPDFILGIPVADGQARGVGRA